MKGCLTETTTSLVAKLLVLYKFNFLISGMKESLITRNIISEIMKTSGFATTHVVVSVRHPITY